MSEEMLELAPQSVEAIARRVAEILAPRQPAELLSAAELAHRLGVTRNFIYEHRDELGAMKLGDGPRPRLRFDLEKAREGLVLCSRSKRTGTAEKQGSEPNPPVRRSRRTGTRSDLLPIRGSRGR